MIPLKNGFAAAQKIFFASRWFAHNCDWFPDVKSNHGTAKNI